MSVCTTCEAERHPGGRPVTTARILETDPAKVAKTLAAADIWLLPQPKSVAVTTERFDLA